MSDARRLKSGRDLPRRRPALRAVALYALTLLVVVTIVFAIPRGMPGDPLASLIDPNDPGALTNEAIRAELMAYYGLDRPLVEQYGSYLANVARGELGWSISRNTPVKELIVGRLPWTLLLMGTAVGASAAISFVAGVAAGWRRGRLGDRATTLAMTMVNGIPDYALAAALLIAFAVVIPLFPVAGARTPFARYPSGLDEIGDVARHLVLPATALTLSLLGNKFLLVRNTVVTSLGQDYMVLAEAKGLPVRLRKYRHAGRNALLPFLTVVGLQVGFAVGGTIFVESVFAYPGMGSLILQAVEARDFPVLEASFLAFAVVVLASNLALELLYRRVDPRVGAE